MRRVARGFVIGGFTDHHVHLQLVDAPMLAESVLGRVVDLGGDPYALANVDNSSLLTRTPGDAGRSGQNPAGSEELRTRGAVEIEFAGAFLTPPGGYPSDRAWAPAGSVREVADADAAAAAVAEMADAGASSIKVAGNSTAGPVLPDDVFSVVIRRAAARDLPVVVHAEGAGEAQRAVRLGAARLAHAPFTERLTDAEIAVQAASVQWISTLAIHAGRTYATAIDNVRRFHAAGGTVLYGTDMGNDDTPVGLNEREIAALRDAGIDDDDLIRALAPVDGARELFIPGARPDPLLARPLTPEDLEA